MKALIVDDSAVMRKVIARALSQAGLDALETVEAANGAEGLAALRSMQAEMPSGCPDIILTDINMPMMDGLEFVERMRDEKLAERVPVVMITTEGAEQQVMRAIAAGARGYICKPFTPGEVKDRLLPLLRGNR